MREFLLGILMLTPWMGMAATGPTGLSSPILTNFWLRDFNIDSTQPNTKLITLNLNSQQFDNGGSTITITNLFGPGVTNIFDTFITSNIFTTNLTVQNFFVTNTVFTNISVFETTVTSNLFVTNIDASVTITTNLFVTNLFVTYEVVSNVVAGNIQGTPPHLAMFRPDNFSVADSIVTQNADTNGVTVNGTGNANVTLGGSGSPTIVIGDGNTNTISRSGKLLTYANGGSGVFFRVIQGDGKRADFGISTGDNLTLLADTGQAIFFGPNNNGSGYFFMDQNGFYPVTANSVDLGAVGVPWKRQYVAGNVGAIITGGDTTFVDMQRATQTNQLSGALTFAHATNGTDLVEFTHRRYLFNPSGANRLITLPSGWHNISGASFTVTNSTMARLDVTSWGDTSTSANQTNVSSSVTFMP